MMILKHLTYFPLRNKKIKPEKGKAALFFNLYENNIDKLENSKHAGLSSKNGIKWMCNVWVRLNKIYLMNINKYLNNIYK